MAVSRMCDECWRVKRTRAYPVDRPGDRILGSLVYLCTPCARTLGYASPRLAEKVSR